METSNTSSESVEAILSCLRKYIGAFQSQIDEMAVEDLRENLNSDLLALMSASSWNFSGESYRLIKEGIGLNDIAAIANAVFYVNKLGTESALGSLKNAIEDAVSTDFTMDVAAPAAREMIVCLEGPYNVDSLCRNDRAQNFLLMPGQWLKKINDKAAEDKKFIFGVGHPRNGCTYIQHPLKTNQYFEVNEFHYRMLEQKQNELLRLFEALGAKSATVEIVYESEESSEKNYSVSSGASASAENVPVPGMPIPISASAFVDERRDQNCQERMNVMQSAKKEIAFNPSGKPHIPDGLLFYGAEDEWQQLSASALRGGIKHVSIDLEYKSEYGVTEKHLAEEKQKIGVYCFSFSMKLNENFSQSLNQMMHTRWHYEVDFGDAPRVQLNDAVANDIDENIARVASLLRAKAKLFIENDGIDVSDEHRRRLIEMGERYGVDELRIEELILEAVK